MKKIKIYAFEGLFSYHRNFLSSQLRELNLEFEKYSWVSKPEIDEGSIICGHSYGGHRAIELANLYKPAALFTFDPRKPFSNKPEFRVKCLAFNYFQLSGLKGYTVHGAVNQFEPKYTHKTIPQSNQFKKDIIAVIKMLNERAE